MALASRRSEYYSPAPSSAPKEVVVLLVAAAVVAEVVGVATATEVAVGFAVATEAVVESSVVKVAHHSRIASSDHAPVYTVLVFVGNPPQISSQLGDRSQLSVLKPSPLEAETGYSFDVAQPWL